MNILTDQKTRFSYIRPLFTTLGYREERRKSTSNHLARETTKISNSGYTLRSNLSSR